MTKQNKETKTTNRASVRREITLSGTIYTSLKSKGGGESLKK